MNIDRKTGGCESIVATITNFDKHQAVSVTHDQVDLAEAATKISRYAGQALANQESVSGALRIIPYSSGVGSYHDSSSAASGDNNSGSSLMSRIGPPVTSISGSATGSPL